MTVLMGSFNAIYFLKILINQKKNPGIFFIHANIVNEVVALITC